MVLGNLACTTHGSCDGMSPVKPIEPLAAMETVAKLSVALRLYGVPTMFIGTAGSSAVFSSFDFSSLRTGIMAGSPCPVEVMRKVQSQPCIMPRSHDLPTA